MLEELYAFAKNPVFTKDENKNFDYRLQRLFKLVGIALGASILLLMVAGVIQLIFGLETGKHAIDDLFEHNTPLVIFLLAVLVAPVLEELIFRGPLAWFKKSNHFPAVFLLFTLAFGFLHITNFEFSLQVWLLSPLLVAPQISVGFILGFIRIKFGLLWSMAMHALYNLILVSPLIVLKLLNIPIA